MSIIGVGNETYLFVNGLIVNRSIELNKDITILPITAEFDYESASKLIKNDIDFSVVVLSGSNLYSQIRITAETAEDLAAKAWNAQWDCLLLGALINNSVMSNIQCDKPVEALKEADYLNVTNYELRGIIGESKELTEKDEEWIKTHYKSAYRLLDNQQYQTAVHCMSTYLWHSLPRVQIAILWSGIESLFNVSTEISFRLSLCIANFLSENDKEKAKEIFTKVRKLYNLRSAAVHGNKMKGDINQIVQDSADLLSALIKKCAELETLPDKDNLIFGHEEEQACPGIID